MPICFEKMLSLQKRLWKQGVKRQTNKDGKNKIYAG